VSFGDVVVQMPPGMLDPTDEQECLPTNRKKIVKEAAA